MQKEKTISLAKCSHSSVKLDTFMEWKTIRIWYRRNYCIYFPSTSTILKNWNVS